jgi:hypothetical protein
MGNIIHIQAKKDERYEREHTHPGIAINKYIGGNIQIQFLTGER